MVDYLDGGGIVGEIGSFVDVRGEILLHISDWKVYIELEGHTRSGRPAYFLLNAMVEGSCRDSRGSMKRWESRGQHVVVRFWR